MLTGDYRTRLHGLSKDVMIGLNHLVDNIRSRHGFIGILGITTTAIWSIPWSRWESVC